ncbi:hypothetical protein HDV03_004781 [Kappamyces sp. JEL0829]|nr:hypothetical protein HDV03_004781 [Kappamyces sp. JEL0829]
MVNRDTDQILLLNVRNYSAEYSIGYPFAPYEFPPDQLSEMEEAAKKHSHQLLVNYAKDFQKQGIHVRAVALQGDARDCLTHKINSVKPSFVIMSKRGLGVFSRTLLGSVSQHLIHHCLVPVLVLPVKS